MKLSVVIMFLLTIEGMARGSIIDSNGVEFVSDKNWNSILKEARIQGKYIFVDCVATWCKPCAKMDRETYSNKSIGKYVSKYFISVKVQIDSTNKDNNFIKSWYEDAVSFKEKYKIDAVPLFLFFSPDGELIHKEKAYKDSASFMNMIINAMDPQKQYCKLLDGYQKGERNYLSMEYLVSFCLSFGEEKWAKEISMNYITEFLLKLPNSSIYTERNIRFIAEHYLSSKNKKAFELFYLNQSRIDSVVNQRGYAQAIVDKVITKELIDPVVHKSNSPDWNSINKCITRKYDSTYANRTVLWAKMKWYTYKQMWTELANARIAYFERYGMDTSGFFAKLVINSVCWNEIFLHVSDKIILEKAVSWMEMLVKSDGASNMLGVYYSHFIDTYANLLYKSGRIKEAISWEEMAVLLDPKGKDKVLTFEKMKNGQSTW